jgi:acetyl-CoA carboxylase biotin carboxyl carrier protein
MTLDEIKHLIEFIRAQDLSEFELEQDGMKIRVKSGPAATALPVVSVAPAAPLLAPGPASGAPSVLAAPASSEAPLEDGP